MTSLRVCKVLNWEMNYGCRIGCCGKETQIQIVKNRFTEWLNKRDKSNI